MHIIFMSLVVRCLETIDVCIWCMFVVYQASLKKVF